MTEPLRVIILKPSKYARDGHVERFRWGFMPNSTVPHVRSMTPASVGATPLEIHAIDDYVYTDLDYLSLLKRPRGGGRCWRLWACRVTSSIARSTSRRTPGRTDAWR